ncbi:hypothetical protein PG994_012584 [Apiospora phragmitis]|uniref:Uncharacterized protein n=1 Tax=Apiospora phragmitis TaxID=2905665 RepID=A0ABR1TCM5_9PEZI
MSLETIKVALADEDISPRISPVARSRLTHSECFLLIRPASQEQTKQPNSRPTLLTVVKTICLSAGRTAAWPLIVQPKSRRKDPTDSAAPLIWASNPYQWSYIDIRLYPFRAERTPERLEQILEWTPTSEISGLSRSETNSPVDICLSSPSSGTSIGSLVGLAELEQPGLNELPDRFFMHVHCKNPILDETETRRLVRVAFIKGWDWSLASCLTPAATTWHPAPGPTVTRRSSSPRRRSEWAPLLLQPSIVGTQCLFLSGVYLIPWRLAKAACQGFPFLLTKSAQKAQDFITSLSAAEVSADDMLEQAVYWSAWKSEREVRQELSPTDFPTGSCTPYPTFFPTPPPSRVGTPDGFTDPVLAGMIPEYGRQARQWADSLPKESSIGRETSSTRMEDREEHICRALLRGHLYDLWKLIYWPFMMAAIQLLARGSPNTSTPLLSGILAVAD